MSSNIVIRIHANDQNCAMDWTVSPHCITFRETLEIIGRVCNCTEAHAFEYEDEDGDRITVRSEEEMSNMLSSYLGAGDPSLLMPLTIYPRVGKAPGKRNIFGLKVQTSEDVEDMSNTSASPLEQQDSGSKKQNGHDIGEILAMGNIRETELSYLEIIGSGNAGTVYRACHKSTNTIIAVKVIPLDITVETQQQIISELEILNRCKSCAIITFYGAFFNDNRIFMCTEYMDGGSLDRYGKIQEQVLGRITVMVVTGLKYLWSMRIMHRDVKPCNILVNTKGLVKLCDFSVSVQLVNSIAKTYIGTNAYMAPERVKGEDYGVASEVWSLGVSLYELSVGRFPYDSVKCASATPMDLINSIVNSPPPDLPLGHFSPELVHFVSHSMEPRPEYRLTLEDLMSHPWIQKYSDGNTQIVAEWVCVQIEQSKHTR